MTTTIMAMATTVRRLKTAQTACCNRHYHQLLLLRWYCSTTPTAGERLEPPVGIDSAGPITAAYEKQIEAGKIRPDDDQRQLAVRLDCLHNSLKAANARHRILSSLLFPTNNSETLSVNAISDHSNGNHHHPLTLVAKRILASPRHFVLSKLLPPPKGLYIYGNVGVGKSFLMDLFHHVMIGQTRHAEPLSSRATTALPRKQQVYKNYYDKPRRVHFHEFMLDVHSRIHRYKQVHPKGDALPAVALEIAMESNRVLCFDEFQVTDIADAMILKRLFGMLLQAGVVVVATSNRAPRDLYQGGINRSLFLPFIDTLTANLNVVHMNGGHDYRRDDCDSGKVNKKASSSSSFFWPASDEHVQMAVEGIFQSAGEAAKGGQERSESIPVQMGRSIDVPRANNAVAWFDFMALCHEPLGAADYIALCNRYNVLIVDHVPQLNSERYNEARRFVILIDALYESKTRLVLACDVPLHELFVGFDASVETNDGDEEIALFQQEDEEQKDPAVGDAVSQSQTRMSGDHEEQMFVKGEGGSSSSMATTMIRTKDDGEVEWSATGRIGVSLAQLSAVRDVSFSFQRAESRLVEMTRSSWNSQ